jgi:hypothetical protein
VGGKTRCSRKKQGNPSRNRSCHGFFLWLTQASLATGSRLWLRKKVDFAYKGTAGQLSKAANAALLGFTFYQYTDQQGPGGKLDDPCAADGSRIQRRPDWRKVASMQA